MPRSHLNSSVGLDIAALREHPLLDVLDALGAKRDTYDRVLWICNERRIKVRGSFYYDIESRNGGAGAVDMLCRIQGIGFLDACAAIQMISEGIRGSDLRREIAALSKDHGALHLPQPDAEFIETLVDYLTKDRKINAQLVQGLLRSRQVYPDHHGSLVFVMRDQTGSPCGAEIRTLAASPVTESGIALPKLRLTVGTKRRSGAFFVLGSDPGGRIALVANAIDAMSYVSMRNTDTAISLGDSINHELMDWLGPYLKNSGRDVRCALPVHDAGMHGSTILKARFGFPHLRPDKPAYQPSSPDRAPQAAARDWNELLVRRAEAKALRERPIPQNARDHPEQTLVMGPT